jgi:hypothetical protein
VSVEVAVWVPVVDAVSVVDVVWVCVWVTVPVPVLVSVSVPVLVSEWLAVLVDVAVRLAVLPVSTSPGLALAKRESVGSSTNPTVGGLVDMDVTRSAWPTVVGGAPVQVSTVEPSSIDM